MTTWAEFRKEKLTSKSKDVPYKEWLKLISLEWKQKKLGVAPPPVLPQRPVYLIDLPPQPNSTRARVNEGRLLVDEGVGKGRKSRHKTSLFLKTPLTSIQEDTC